MDRSQLDVPLSRHVTERRTLEDQIDDVPPVKRLDGEVTKRGVLPFAGGLHSEFWLGEWKKGGGIRETVGLSLTTSILR